MVHPVCSWVCATCAGVVALCAGVVALCCVHAHVCLCVQNCFLRYDMHCVIWEAINIYTTFITFVLDLIAMRINS